MDSTPRRSCSRTSQSRRARGSGRPYRSRRWREAHLARTLVTFSRGCAKILQRDAALARPLLARMLAALAVTSAVCTPKPGLQQPGRRQIEQIG